MRLHLRLQQAQAQVCLLLLRAQRRQLAAAPVGRPAPALAEIRTQRQAAAEQSVDDRKHHQVHDQRRRLEGRIDFRVLAGRRAGLDQGLAHFTLDVGGRPLVGEITGHHAGQHRQHHEHPFAPQRPAPVPRERCQRRPGGGHQEKRHEHVHARQRADTPVAHRYRRTEAHQQRKHRDDDAEQQAAAAQPGAAEHRVAVVAAPDRVAAHQDFGGQRPGQAVGFGKFAHGWRSISAAQGVSPRAPVRCAGIAPPPWIQTKDWLPSGCLTGLSSASKASG